MKQFFLLLLAFGLFTIVDVNAQSCLKSKAERAAALDASIVTKVNYTTGEKEYFRKSVSSTDDKVKYTKVEYCTRSARFVNVASQEKKSCVKSKVACTGLYGSKAMAVNNLPAHCTVAQKAACLQANQKAQIAKATFVANTGRTIKP